MATCSQQEKIYAEPLCRVQNKLKFQQRFLKLFLDSEGKIPDVRPVQGSAYIIRLALISGLGAIHKGRLHFRGQGGAGVSD